MKIQRILFYAAIITTVIGCRRNFDTGNAELSTSSNKGSFSYSINAALSPYDNTVLADEPVAFWNGTSINDLTGHGHNGVAMNNPSGGTLPNGDRSFRFDGINQYIQVNNSPDLSVPATGILTLEAWIRPDVPDFPNMEGTGYVNCMGKGEPGEHEYVCRMYGQNPTGNDEGRGNRIVGNAFTLNGNTAAGSYYQPSLDQALTAGEWLHYVFVINTTAVTTQQPHGYTKLYVQRKNNDGSLTTFEDEDTLSSSTLAAGTAPFRIGTRNMNSWFKGAIGKVAIYNYELTSAKILGHGNKMFDYDYLVLSANPIAYWNTAAKDISGNNHSGTIFNNPGITTMPNGDGSLVFNGTTQKVEVADKPELSIPATGILTLEAWIRPDVPDFEDMEGTGYVHWMGKCENKKCEYVARMYGTNPVRDDTGRTNRISGYAFNLSGGKGAGSYYQAGPSWLVQPGEWIHYTLVLNTVDTSSGYPTGYTKLYVHRKNSSGTVVTFQDKDSLIGYSIIPQDGTAPFRIATANDSSFFHGSIGKVAMYNYELSAAQSLEHAQKIFNP
jgi:concanavalin A-like lectin/glucanase superfamily protein